jgi:hypothetical protein
MRPRDCRSVKRPALLLVAAVEGEHNWCSPAALSSLMPSSLDTLLISSPVTCCRDAHLDPPHRGLPTSSATEPDRSSFPRVDQGDVGATPPGPRFSRWEDMNHRVIGFLQLLEDLPDLHPFPWGRDRRSVRRG